ncbi:hypothetical protein CAPTEDRAFT_217982 [Capitella teleta]|uniref:DDE Tnp4 domain-containing protein n=1 Tax=Capitella teleta TaxID=283909 RepID=R7TB43_CAPTE|nr:hypothetical protein CAPTEDRAFT_217982 [Capitella teleta]|eukprot:ELT88219.1 hypothetical protein CAPTEDRAFT_217982 [Capitella teleta]
MAPESARVSISRERQVCKVKFQKTGSFTWPWKNSRFSLLPWESAVLVALRQGFSWFSNDRENSSPRGCTLLRQAEPGDTIMADKEFNVQDLLETSNVVINIPTFSKRKNRMINATVMRDRRISSKRVHVERIIGLAKNMQDSDSSP